MTQQAKQALIIGNWKMHKSIAEARAFISTLALTGHKPENQVGLAVPFTMISAAATAARGSSIAIGAQNVSNHSEGAFTGEISAAMLQDAGASFVIVGHSERRQFFHENDELVNSKVKRALSNGLRVVLCVGETFEQHQQGKTEITLQNQIQNSLKGLSAHEFAHIVLAYEPIWAIGTNLTALPEKAQETHRFCRAVISSLWGSEVAQRLIIQYGGSVKPENAKLLLAQPDINGLLVGGASLSLDSFSKIIQS